MFIVREWQRNMESLSLSFISSIPLSMATVVDCGPVMPIALELQA
jgi:hypothetical protein